MHSENLFTNYSQFENNAPLADKLRPKNLEDFFGQQPILNENCLLYTSPSPRDRPLSRMPSSA